MSREILARLETTSVMLLHVSIKRRDKGGNFPLTGSSCV